MRIGIVGGGASGMAAAITAARHGAQVTILERNDRIGKKLLATGNGKCNLSNLDFCTEYYRSENPECIGPVFEQIAVGETKAFFEQIGLMIKQKNGYLYPECEQASAVSDVLRQELAYLGVRVLCDEEVLTVTGQKNKGFRLDAQSGNTYFFDRVVIACGTSAGLKKGTKTSLPQNIAKRYGLQWVSQAPALVQLCCEEKFCKSLSGVRCQAKISLHMDKNSYRETGELQLTDYGISGIPVFQLSRYAAYGLVKKKSLPVEIDFMPSMREKEWKEFLWERKRRLSYKTMEEFLVGTVHKKIAAVLLKQCGFHPGEAVSHVSEAKFQRLVWMLKHFPMTVIGTKPIENAQVCAGGIKLTEVSEFMESFKCKGLYLTGELLDVDGRCGGYNLQWAWSTGIIAGKAAAKADEVFIGNR